jgi:hypothetical protein
VISLGPLSQSDVPLPVRSAADGCTLGPALGVGWGSDIKTGVVFGEASGFGGGVTLAWSLAVGDAAGKMTTRGVGEAPDSGEPSEAVEAVSVD